MALNTDKLEKTREEYASYVEPQAQDILDKLIKNGGVHTVSTNNHDSYGWDSKRHQAMPDIVRCLEAAGVGCDGPTVSHGVTDWRFKISV